MNIGEILGVWSSIVGLVAAVFACWGWFKTTELLRSNREVRMRREALITIILETEGNSDLEIPYKPRRDQLSRAELLGILGLYCGETHFDRSLLFNILQDGTFDRILAGKEPASSEDEILRIKCPLSTYEQFQKVIAGHKSTSTRTVV